MRKVILILIAAITLSGCTSSNEFGKCIGAWDDEDPALKYKPSVWNIIVGVVFIELIAPPVYVLVDQAKCPVSRK